MIKNFKLETILSILTGVNLGNSHMDIFELAWFVFDDKYINDSGFIILEKKLINHLYAIHPELITLEYNKYSYIMDLDNFVKVQKEKFGDSLPICRIGENLEELIQEQKKNNVIKRMPKHNGTKNRRPGKGHRNH